MKILCEIIEILVEGLKLQVAKKKRKVFSINKTYQFY